MPNAKVTLNGTTLIDLTSDSVTASALVSGVTAHDSSGALITGMIAAKTSADITVAGPTVTIPGGVYSGSNSKTIPQASINSSFVWRVDPSISFNSTTGVVTADHDLAMQAELVTQSGYADEMTIYLNPWGVSSYQIPVKASSDITVAGPTVTVSSGYYAGAVSKSVASGSLNEYINMPSITPSWSINSSTGEISVESLVALGIQPIATSGYFENDVYVYPVITLDSSYQLSTKSAAIYTPSTVAQTIASGQYLTGAQTISGDTNLIAANIAAGVSIFGIMGTHEGGSTPTGTISIITNGTFDVTNYAHALVNVGAQVIGERLIVPEGMIGV